MKRKEKSCGEKYGFLCRMFELDGEYCTKSTFRYSIGRISIEIKHVAFYGGCAGIFLWFRLWQIFFIQVYKFSGFLKFFGRSFVEETPCRQGKKLIYSKILLLFCWDENTFQKLIWIFISRDLYTITVIYDIEIVRF